MYIYMKLSMLCLQIKFTESSGRNVNKDSAVRTGSRIVHFNFRAGSTFPVPVCTVPHGHWVNKGLAGAIRLTRSDFMLHIG